MFDFDPGFLQNHPAVSPIGRNTRLIFGSLGLTCAVAMADTDLARAQSTVPPGESGTPAPGIKPSTPPARAVVPAATPPVQAPNVTLEVVADRDAVERDETLAIVVILTNKADAGLTGVKISVPSAAFEPPSLPSGASAPPEPSSVSAFGTMHHTIALKPRPLAAFGPHKVPVVVEYAWSPPTGAKRTSAQTATLTLQVKRRFEEEGKGLPGGTAVFLYLLLPVVPAFLAYDVVEHLRKGDGFTMPKFGTEHIVPAFLVSLVLSVALATAVNFNVELAYTNPRLFLSVLGLSAVLGAAVPAVRWIYWVYERWRWAFKNGDSSSEYLRKALLGPRTPAQFVWVEGDAGGETWKGVRLHQPDGTVVLGARVQVTTADSAKNGAEWQRLTGQVFHGAQPDAALKDRQLLVKMAKAGTATVNHVESIVRGGASLDSFVAVDGLALLQTKSTSAKPLVQVVR
jgi:hypothetical protein